MVYVVSVNLGKLPRQVKLILALRPSFIISEKALMHFRDNIQSIRRLRFSFHLSPCSGCLFMAQ